MICDPTDGPVANSANRREFLKRLAVDSVAAVGVLAGGYALLREVPSVAEEESAAASPESALAPARRAAERADAPPVRSVLGIAKGEDPGVLTRLAVESVGGMKTFVAPGDRVLLKPNIGWDRRPKFAANTNPDVVAAAARMCLAAGAREVVVTDSPCNHPARCFDKSGLAEALNGLDVRLFVPTERDYVERDLGGEVLGVWPVLRAVLECDKVINLPIAKHHSSAILSLGMKNWFGILGGGKLRGRLHQEMARAIAELAAYVRPCLTILDAYRILVRNGPQGGSLDDTREVKTVVASTDPVAVDAWAATLFDLAPDQVPFVPEAQRLGLGTADLASVETIVMD